MLESNQSGLYSDLWALGCIIYELSSGLKMFKGNQNHEVFNKILSHNIDFGAIHDEDALDLIKRLCEVEPQDRIGLKNILQIKKHPFFEDIDFDEI